jgi:hypothetical protein
MNPDVVIKLAMNDGFASGGQHGPKEAWTERAFAPS